MKIHKLYFSDKSRAVVASARQDLESQHLPEFELFGATFIETTGYWVGKTEPGFMLEMIDLDETNIAFAVRQIARRLVKEYGQQSVLVATQEIDAYLVTA